MSRPALITSLIKLREASDTWDRAHAALMRRDYREYDEITGFKEAKQ